MTPQELRTVKQQVMKRYHRYSSENVRCMIMDCQAYLAQSALLRLARGKRKGKKTGDAMALFVLHCEPRAATTSAEDLSAELERIWLHDLRFTEEAHTLERRDASLILDFITWWPKSDGSFVTGNIVLALPTAPPSP